MASPITLRVRPEVLERTAQSMEQQLKAIDRSLEALEKAVKNSRRYWEGTASDAHLKYYEGYKDEIAQVRSRLQADKQKLIEISGIYVQNEAENVNLSASLSSDVIL